MTRMVAAVLLVLVACGGDPTSGPPEIQLGLEECGFCRMIISEEKFAAALVDQTGVTTSFDDLGCLLNHLREQPAVLESRAGGAQSWGVWVHDHAGGGWIDAAAAVFVRGPRSATPMGSGLVAFASQQAADAHASAEGVDTLAWAALLERSTDD